MYKAIVRWMIRRNVAKSNDGDYASGLAMFAEDATLSFPGRTHGPTSIAPPSKAVMPSPLIGAAPRSRRFSSASWTSGFTWSSTTWS